MTPRSTRRADGRYGITARLDNPDGSSRRVYFYGRTQTEARAKANAARERAAAGLPVRDATRAVTDWLAEWRATFLASSDRAPSTKELYAGLTRRHVEPVIGALPLGQVRPSEVTRVLLAMEQAGLAASTRRNTYAALRSALDDAVAEGLLAVNPVLRVRRPRGSSAEAASLHPDDMARFLAATQGLRYGGVLRLILGTGLRRGEALAIRWSEVRLDRAEILIRGSLVRREGQLVVSAPKSARSRRTVSMGPSVVSYLAEHRSRQAAERVAAGTLWDDSGFVFTTELGHPADPRNLLRAAALAAKRAGLPPLGVHTLRHTYATTALLHGVPIHVVSRNLGHSSIAITADIYGHLTDEAAHSAAQVVSDALGL